LISGFGVSIFPISERASAPLYAVSRRNQRLEVKPLHLGRGAKIKNQNPKI